MDNIPDNGRKWTAAPFRLSPSYLRAVVILFEDASIREDKLSHFRAGHFPFGVAGGLPFSAKDSDALLRSTQTLQPFAARRSTSSG